MLLTEVQHREVQKIRPHDTDDRDRRFQFIRDKISQRNLAEDFVLGFKPAANGPGFG
jgi:hypothetical protein